MAHATKTVDNYLDIADDVGGEEFAFSETARPLLSGAGYQKLRRTVVFATTLVAIVPLVIMAVLNYVQYARTLREDTIQNITRLLTNNKQSLEFFLLERRSALGYLVRERSFTQLGDPKALGQIIRQMNESFSHGMFVDLGLIDSKGKQLCYNGPHKLEGRDYSEQDWFHRVIRRGTFTSEVFLGYRNSPHFAIATRHARGIEDYYILRATFDAEVLSKQIHTAGLGLYDDIFLINRAGVLQTESRRYGKTLTTIPLDVPRDSPGVEAVLHEDERGQSIFLGSATIEDSPFILIFIKPSHHASGYWFVPARLFGFLAISCLVVVAVILWGSGQFVRGLRAASIRRAIVMHKVEYNNKLASIGRLAAGVAHEINNPLAIINEKTGLIKDIVLRQEEFPRREKFLDVLDSVLRSVTRCKTITHRLLGFAKHMGVQREVIDLPVLLKEVVGFLVGETVHRGIHIALNTDQDVPNIESDRGQLQQIFLNVLNNAVSAVKDGGRIDIEVSKHAEEWVSISVSDDGVGISEENLQRIFEPFFTTKEGTGTGLGLSITYGIVRKLGGKISVDSQLGQGTCFTVLLPITSEK